MAGTADELCRFDSAQGKVIQASSSRKLYTIVYLRRGEESMKTKARLKESEGKNLSILIRRSDEEFETKTEACAFDY